nr:MAG: ORF1 [TTV-like mini virus]
MPPYRSFYTYRRWRRPRNRRRWISRRRIRPSFHRRRWRKRRQRYYKVKRRRFLKKFKRKSLKLKVFQPTTINFCKIKGYKCLYQGSVKRLSHNFIQSIYSMTPEPYPNGGGWSLLVFSLDSLFEDFQHLENFWTKGNAGLPLVRYLGCKFKLFQSENSDYVFTYDNCWPMVDTQHTHANSSPSRMLYKLHKVTVPSLKTKKKRRPYKVVKIKPPAQMTNNWYFTRDIHKIPLVMTTTTAVSLTTPFINTKQQNYNITLKCLNPLQFQNPNFQHFDETLGYSPKWLPIGTINYRMYWYASRMKLPNEGTTYEFLKQLIFLGNTKQNQEGRELVDIAEHNLSNTKSNWGNPFYHAFLEHTAETSYTIYMTKETIVNIINQMKTNKTNPTELKKLNFTEITGPLIYILTYNSQRDTGENNLIYLVPTIDENNITPPENESLKFHGFPLPILLWGWTDWVKKLKLASNMENDYVLIIETKMFDENLSKYILLDFDFIEGYDPYQDHNEHYQKNYYNFNNWFPCLRYQNQSIEKICQTDFGTYKADNNNSIQALCKYCFYFKFGGCPKTIPKPYDPSLQPIWTTADNIHGRPEIQDPSIRPETELFKWDWEKDYVTQRAIERIKQYTSFTEPLLSTESKSSAKAQKAQEKTTKEKEKEETLYLLQQLRKQQLLQQLLHKFQLKK